MTVGDRRFPFVLARMWHASAGEHRSGGRRLSVLGTNTTAMKRPVRHALTRAKLRGSLGLSVYWRIVRLCPWRDSNPQSADGASLRGWCVCQFRHRGLEYRPLRVASADQAAGTPVLWLPSVPIHCGRLSWAYWTQGSRSTAPELPYADPRVLDPRRLLPSKVLQRVSNLALVILMTIILKFETNLGGSSRPAELFQCFQGQTAQRHLGHWLAEHLPRAWRYPRLGNWVGLRRLGPFRFWQLDPRFWLRDLSWG